MFSASQKSMKLKDGDKIAVIGGGPAGSFFSYYALDMIERFDLNVGIDIYETKDFSKIGAGGCNHCGGVISESLVQKLSTDGIIVPDDIIQRGLNSYTLHTEEGSEVIHTPGLESRIASVFRGCGPRGCIGNEKYGFDQFLLETCRRKGANLIQKRVSFVERVQHGIYLGCGKDPVKKYNLIVAACGLNKKTLELFSSICDNYIPPETTRTYISEILLEPESINDFFGNSMHVFLLNLPNITFAALIPKDKYVTLVLLGKEIDNKIVNSFLQSEVVKKCFPPEVNIKLSAPCKCYPLLNLKEAMHPFNDRVVFIGDAASSKLYKNGIGAAYITAKAAVSAILFEGYSKKLLKKTYATTCHKLNRDNRIGRFIFFLTRLIQKSPLLKRGMLNLIKKERSFEPDKRVFSRNLWDTFTGSADYKSIFYHMIHPVMIVNFIKSIIK